MRNNNKELKNFLRTFENNVYGFILYNPTTQCLLLDESSQFNYFNVFDTKTINKVEYKLIKFENDQYLFKRFIAVAAYKDHVKINENIDRETFIEKIELALYEHLENDKVITEYLAWLQERGYKQVHEFFSVNNNRKGFLYRFPNIKLDLEKQFNS